MCYVHRFPSGTSTKSSPCPMSCSSETKNRLNMILPSGKRLRSYGKSQFSMGKSTVNYWLVVSNMNFIFHFIYGMSSFPLTHSIIFRDGYCTTNQILLCCSGMFFLMVMMAMIQAYTQNWHDHRYSQ